MNLNKVYIKAISIEGNRVYISTLNQESNPIEPAFLGSWNEALKERNKRAERWSETASEVTSDGMPIMFG